MKLMSYTIHNKAVRLFLILGGIFIANALMAEFIGVKIFSLEKTLGLDPIHFSLFGYKDLAFNLTAGVLLWPVVFLMTDIINEYYGPKGVKLLSFLAVGLIVYAFVMVYLAVYLSPADFWPTSHIRPSWTEIQKQDMMEAVGDYNTAFSLVFGQGLWIIIGSLVAFLVGQFVDVMTFHRIKKVTGDQKMWLRATGSTLISQFIDSFIVLFIAFYIGAGWDIRLVLAIGLVNYFYKFTIAILLTPIIYLAHNLIDNYLGKNLANELKTQAMN